MKWYTVTTFLITTN